VGAVEIFNPSNNTFQPLIPSTDADLKEPWGITLAPSTFGQFGGDPLGSNKFDGTINAYNPTTGAYVGTLTDVKGNPIVNPGLWGLAFRSATSGFNPNTLYFANRVGFVVGGLGNGYLRPQPLRRHHGCPRTVRGAPLRPGDDCLLRRLLLGIAPASAGLRSATGREGRSRGMNSFGTATNPGDSKQGRRCERVTGSNE
jgi:hypothetical protein